MISIVLYYVPIYGAFLILWGYLNSRGLSKSENLTWWNKTLIRISSFSGFLGGLITILGIMHTLIINLGKSIAIHEFNHSATWVVLGVGAFAALISLVFYLKTRKFWPELLITILSILEVVACFMIIGYFSR
jgi:hypothetical protein